MHPGDRYDGLAVDVDQVECFDPVIAAMSAKAKGNFCSTGPLVDLTDDSDEDTEQEEEVTAQAPEPCRCVSIVMVDSNHIRGCLSIIWDACHWCIYKSHHNFVSRRSIASVPER